MMKTQMLKLMSNERSQKIIRWAGVGAAVLALLAGSAVSVNAEGPIIPW